MNQRIKIHVDPDLADLIPNFVNNRRKDIQAIQQSLTNHNFEDIRRIGHTIKGVAPSYGFKRLGEIGKALEDSAISHDLKSIESLLAEIDFIINNYDIVE